MKTICKLFVLMALLFTVNASAQSIPKWKVADLERAINASEKPTIFAFWASFCKPCLEELPYFQELMKKYNSAGVQLILVNLDMQETYPRLGKFAQKLKLTAPIIFLDETDADLFCPVVDPKWSGAIPASLFINNKKKYRKFFEDQISKSDLEKEIKALIE